MEKNHEIKTDAELLFGLSVHAARNLSGERVLCQHLGSWLPPGLLYADAFCGSLQIQHQDFSPGARCEHQVLLARPSAHAQPQFLETLRILEALEAQVGLSATVSLLQSKNWEQTKFGERNSKRPPKAHDAGAAPGFATPRLGCLPGDMHSHAHCRTSQSEHDFAVSAPRPVERAMLLSLPKDDSILPVGMSRIEDA